MDSEDRAVCEAVRKLRLSLGLSQRIFGRQIGVDERTVGRWERKMFCPGQKHLVRLKQLEDLNKNLDGEQKAAIEWVGSKDEPKVRLLRGKERKKILEAALAVLILRERSAVLLSTEEVQGQFGKHVRIRESKKKGTYGFAVVISNRRMWPKKETTKK
jgi:transcriptional regulator with XRE-family HTH domain